MKPLLSGFSVAAALLGLSISTASAGTIPYPNTGSINSDTYTFSAGSTGTLTAYFYASTAADTEYLNIYDVSSGASITNIFNNHTTATGTTATLAVNAGDTLVFTVNDTTSGHTISSVSSANADSAEHIYSTAFAGGNINVATNSGQGSAFIPAGTYIGFEDTLMGSSDKNYADEQFVFTNVATEVPEPTTLLVLGTALVGAGAAHRMRRHIS